MRVLLDTNVILEEFLYAVLPYIEIVKTSKKTKDVEKKIRDPKDRPILRAALEENLDLLITGETSSAAGHDI